MDNEPLWSVDDVGNYWLVFPNKHALTKEEIRDIFSQFGKVKNVTTAGDEKGLRFVQYSVLQDVKNAVDNLRCHPTVKLIPHRPKNKKTANSNITSKDYPGNNLNSQQTVTNNDDRRNFYEKKSSRDNNFKNSCDSIPSSNGSKSIFEQFKKLRTPSTDNVSVCSSSDDKASFGGQNSGNKLNTKCFETYSPPKLVGFSNLVQKYKALGNSKPSSFTTSESPDNSISDLICDDDLPELITKRKSKSHSQQRMVFLNAEEIVVANIPKEYGCAYILHLFEKFEPLAISYMLTVSKSETRYCHVYFKTPQDSIDVERIFDNYNLAGQKLIVLRPSSLVKERS